MQGAQGYAELGPQGWLDDPGLPDLGPPDGGEVTEIVVVREPPHEQMIDWLERVVGGERALADLDAVPLPGSAPVDGAGLPAHERELVQAVDEHLVHASHAWVYGDEVLTASRRLLVAAQRAGALRPWRDLEPHQIAASLVHCIAKANALVGAGAPFTVAHWLRDLGATSAPASRSSSLARVIGGESWPHGARPAEAPEVYVLGDVDLLVSRFRRQLILYRGLAERIREQ